MPTRRIQQQVTRSLEAIEGATEEGDWFRVRRLAVEVLALVPDQPDALAYMQASHRALSMANGRRKRRWTAAEEEELRRLAGAEEAGEIARRMNRTAEAIRHRVPAGSLVEDRPPAGGALKDHRAPPR